MKQRHSPVYDAPSTEPQSNEPQALAIADGLEPLILTASDVKQWFVCARVVWYQRLLGAWRPTTYAMQTGNEMHTRQQARLRRRHLRTLPQGDYHMDLHLFDAELGLSGRPDLIIETAHEHIPVDFKDSTNVQGKHVAMQIAAYGLLLTRQGRKVTRGIVYSLPRRRLREIRLDTRRLREVESVVQTMRSHLLAEQLPPPTTKRALCVSCEFRRYCNDIF
ncbi:MAG: CRISPR-associated protein Cas4 [Ardenticatenia bacterium]|nr:MAG: CRISPR-associated protein Cas4 [Ardenticatenia bacterium]